MPTARLKQKRQITVPAEICRLIQADKGDVFNFEFDGEKIIMRLQRSSLAKEKKSHAEGVDISQYIGSMKGSFGSVDQIDAYIRNERASWDYGKP